MTNLLCKIFIKDSENTDSPTVREKYGTLSAVVGITVNLLLSALKIFLGLFTGLAAILADGLNNLSDSGSSLVSLVSFKISSKPADRDHPFGHARIEYIASLIVSFFILLVGFELFTDSATTLYNIIQGNPPKTKDTLSPIILVLLGLSITVKLWLGVFYNKIAKRIDSVVIKASSADSFSDCLSTGAVLISSVIIYFFPGLYFIDAIVGIGVAVLIFIAGIKILNETKNSLLGEAPVEETVKSIHSIIHRFPEALGVHDLIIHNYGPKNLIISLHIEVDGNKNIFDLHDVIDTIESTIHKELGYPCTIHMDPIVTDDETVSELSLFVKRIIETIDPSVTMHDFRTVVGATHTNLIFDVVLPFESKDTPEKITKKISDAVLAERPNYYCVITVDRG